VLFSSGRGNALPQFEQRCERAGFSTPHDRHFITEGWPSHGQLGDYPARLRERQEVSCWNALSSSLQTQYTPCTGKGRKSQPRLSRQVVTLTLKSFHPSAPFDPCLAELLPRAALASQVRLSRTYLFHHTIPPAYCLPLRLS
jgi:hypothetical protein